MKKVRLILLILFLSVSFALSYEPADAKVLEETLMNETFADNIQWVYTTINGVLHRRLYNYSKQEYIGDWIPVTST